MSVRSRVAFASGAAGAVGAALLLSGRFEGSVVLALLLVLSIRTASLASLVDAGPILAAGALRGLRARLWLSPVWVLACAAAIARAGSTTLADVRGVNAIAGIALAYGPVVTVAGSWLAFGAAVIALVSWSPLGAETGGDPGTAGRVDVPPSLKRLDAVGILAEASLLVSLFLGPQVVAGGDGAWWITGIVALAAGAWIVRRRRLLFPATSPAASAAIAALGLVLVLAGGSP